MTKKDELSEKERLEIADFFGETTDHLVRSCILFTYTVRSANMVRNGFKHQFFDNHGSTEHLELFMDRAVPRIERLLKERHFDVKSSDVAKIVDKVIEDILRPSPIDEGH